MDGRKLTRQKYSDNDTALNSHMEQAVSYREALERLQDGNKRFLNGVNERNLHIGDNQRKSQLAGQHPFAVILGCSDSRVPAELVFDQGIGDLFVIRVAGNIVAPSQIGSVEFAVQQFNTKLVVVLGHSGCGAVKATIEELKRPSVDRSPNLHAIVDRIRPSVEVLLDSAGDYTYERLVEKAVRSNIRFAASQLRHGSRILEELVDKEEIQVVGAEYLLETGEVCFFEGIPKGYLV